MTRKLMDLNDLFNEVEAERAAQAQAEIQKEQQEWDDLSDDERARINQHRAERYEAMFDDMQDEVDDTDEDDDDSDE